MDGNSPKSFMARLSYEKEKREAASEGRMLFITALQAAHKQIWISLVFWMPHGVVKEVIIW